MKTTKERIYKVTLAVGFANATWIPYDIPVKCSGVKPSEMFLKEILLNSAARCFLKEFESSAKMEPNCPEIAFIHLRCYEEKNK